MRTSVGVDGIRQLDLRAPATRTAIVRAELRSRGEEHMDHDDSPEPTGKVTISFPVDCKYVGGHRALGRHGHHFRIEQGRIGYGEFELTHSIPLTEVTVVVVAQREVEEPAAGGPVVAMGGGGLILAGGGLPSRRLKVTTDITVRTTDGQEAVWTVEQRDGRWVRDKLAKTLHQEGIRLD
jgi:hypothetical protein